METTLLGNVVNAEVAYVHDTNAHRMQRVAWIGAKALWHFVERRNLRKDAAENVAGVFGGTQLERDMGIDVAQVLMRSIRYLDVPTHSANSRVRLETTAESGCLRPADMSSNPLETSASNSASVIVAAFGRRFAGNCTAKGKPRCSTIWR